MNKQTKITILAFALLLATTSTSQAQGSFEVAIMSPETATLGKFGSYPASNYTGSVDINLPLYLYKSHEVEIPVSLSYDASGFMPNKESGKVGQNWVVRHQDTGRPLRRKQDQDHAAVGIDLERRDLSRHVYV